MARSVSTKSFYLAFALLVIVGAGAIWLARGKKESPVEVGPVPVAADGFRGYTLGSDSAPVEIVEYADFECPACGHFVILTAPDIKSRLVETGRVRFRFRDFPLPGHTKSPAAHMAAACAGEQGQFWPMFEQIFYTQAAWSKARRPERTFRDYAAALRLNLEQFDACVGERRYAGRIEAARQEGAAIGVNATPTFVIGGLLVSGALPYDSIVKLVERAERARQP